MLNAISIAEKLKKLRINVTLSQTDIAKKLYISNQWIRKWENAHAIPTAEHTVGSAQIFDVPTTAIISRKIKEAKA